MTYHRKRHFAETLLPSYDDLLPAALAWIRTFLSPAEVFSEADLKAWAETNGYVKT